MATAAGAMIAKARREVEELFFNANAFSPDRAVEFEARVPVQRRYLEQLIAEGIVHEVSPDRYWFDLPVYKERQRKQFVWGMRVLAVAAVIFLLLFVVNLVLHFA